MSTELDLSHFEELRRRVNGRLRELGTANAELQITHYPWLYGALGAVPSDVMFVCENPSLSGVARAHVQTIDGNQPDIEAQWWGGPRNAAAVRFRVALHELGLKTTPPSARGGWNCYITNVVKEANIVKDQRKLDVRERRAQAVHWADLLSWELTQVRPRYVFAVGGQAAMALRHLRKHRLIPNVPVSPICHYSARASHQTVIDEMAGGVGRTMEATA
jgi:hypothetical protein